MPLQAFCDSRLRRDPGTRIVSGWHPPAPWSSHSAIITKHFHPLPFTNKFKALRSGIMPDRLIQHITLLSFRTFGDYVLKAPFLFELWKMYPSADVTVITNRKGGQVYPLLDSRLKVIIVDHGDDKMSMLRRLRRMPKADLVFSLDDSRTTLILSLVVRG